MQALLTWRANTATGPAPFNPAFVHITPPDERAYLHELWPGGPVLDGNIAAWPLRAAPAGPLDVTDAGAGAKAKVAACTGAATQKWAIAQTSANDFGSISNIGTGAVLTDPGGSTTNGTLLVMATGNGDQSPLRKPDRTVDQLAKPSWPLAYR